MNKGLIALLAACTLLFGCASQRVTPEQQALNELKWDYAENAIVLNFSASKDLNQYAGQSHNLLVVITQFDQANAIAPYIAGPQQLSNLLLMESAPAGLISLTRVFLQPGETKTLRLARLEGTKMVGVAAGYAHLDPARSFKLYQIGVDMTSSGLLKKTWKATLRPIAIDLLMAADTVLRSQQSRLDPVPVVQPKEGEVPLPGTNLTLDHAQ